MKRIHFKIFILLALLVVGTLAAVVLFSDANSINASTLALSLVVGLVAAFLGSLRLGQMILEPLRQVGDLARRIASGDRSARLLWARGDERDAVAGAINRMADHISREFDESRGEAQRLEAVLSEMIEGVLVLDIEGRILLVNPAFRELFDTWGKIEDRPLVEVVRLPEVGALIERARESGEPVIRDVQLRGGHDRIVSGRAVRYPSTGPTAGTLAVFHDVTEIRRVDRIRRDFIANASHELRTPLTSIQGYAETLASGPATPEEVESHLNVIQRNVHRMRALIDDLMDLSRVESEGGVGAPTRVDVLALSRRLLSDMRQRLARAGIEASIVPDSAPHAWADRAAIEQVLENLLTNAIRYSDEGASITIDVESKADRLEISVADTGIGIPEELRARIFERFYRVDASRSRALGSTGLGLAIVRHLVQAMGGTIRVESQLGLGSRFTFSVPRAPAEPSAEPSAEPFSEPSKGTRTPEPPDVSPDVPPTPDDGLS